ncbi:AMP-binding protein [Plantactinospora mayteni]|uniref:Carrier domain-containing protein n=1 Tax=Plantactinospora mayteni TaxID=566021 RepID=A0ABQ4EI88_9ACTN|nr:AMP-binding protein [Plantactinospora mayteni]GIG94451.1 hypothetical protein Pma05_10240 [Plantactinospora mayteni]
MPNGPVIESGASRMTWDPAVAHLVHQRIAQHAVARPDAVAVVGTAGALAYRELGIRANQLAHRLRRLGVGTEDVVAVIVDRDSADGPVAALGIWSAGGVYLPIDPRTRPVRVAAMLAAASARALVGTAAAVLPYADRCAATVLLDVDRAELAAEPVHPPAVPMTPDHLAYLVPTLGTAGESRPVAVPHRAILAAVDSVALRSDPGHREGGYLCVATPSFEVYVGDLVRALGSGGRLVLCDTHQVLDPPRLLDLIERTGAQHAVFTPTVLRPLVDHAERTGRTIPLRQILVRGEDWPVAQSLRLLRVAPDARLHNVYGTAETAVENLSHDVTAGEPDGDRVPIGRPFPGVRALVLDADLRPVPAGRTGELYLAGPTAARGYHGHPVATAERFVPCPEGPPGERMYRTGALVRQRPDGALVSVGRADDEIEIRGVRGSLRAVEATLARHRGVSSVATVLVRRTGDAVLVAHVVPVGAKEGLEQRLRDHAAATLPPAMVPVAVRLWDRLPATPGGGLDRQELVRQSSVDLGDTSPAAVIGALWGELLGQPPGTDDEDLFDAGGSWITATRLAAAVRAALRTDVSDAEVFAAPTVGGIASAVPKETAGPPGRATPLSPLQRRIWLLHRLEPDNPAYHIPALVRLTGSLDRDLLNRALALLVERHDALRTRITAGSDGAPRQHAVQSGPLQVELVEVADRSAADLVEERIRVPFDLTAGPPIRVALLRHAPDRHELLIVVHHIVFDGWSERVLVRELGQVYSALVAGAAPDLPALPVSFAAVAAWQARRLADGTVDADLEYWREHLSDLPPPLDLPDPEGPGGGSLGEVSRRLSEALTARIRATASGHRTTEYTVLLTAFAALLGRWSGRPDLVVGVPHAARDREELDLVVGFFVTTLPLRLRIPGEMTFTSAVRRVGQAVGAGVAHSEAPFDRIVVDLGLGGNPRRSPLFRAWFNLLGSPTAAPEMTGLHTEFAQPPATGALFDLNVYLTEEPDGYRLRLVHDTGVIDAGHAAELTDQYLLLLDAVCTHPDVPVGQHDVRTPASRRALPDEALDLAPDPAPPLLATLWSVRERCPGRTAVTGGGGDLSYADVYDRAVELAGRLLAAGVGPGDVVPVFAARTPALVPALLGIMAAGAAFTVLDAGYPAERLAEQLRQVDARTGVRDPAAGDLPSAVRRVCPQWLDVADGAAPVDGSPGPAPADPAMYVAFTSGTTGVPQGIVGGATPVAHFLRWYVDRFDLGPGDRFAVLSGLAHDPLLRDLLTPLWVGGTACVPPGELLLAPAALRRWLADQRVTVVHLTPPLARLLARPRGAPTSAARLIVLGGDTMRRSDVERVRSWAPHAVVVNAYGATETPQVAALAVVPQRCSGEPVDGPAPVGAGAPGTQLLVVDGAGRPAAVGERGQIVIRGRYLAEGYLRGPDPGRFTGDPVPGHRRFATGDLGRYGTDGTVTVLGRPDDQVKINGVRFELAEIERRLREHPAVADAVAAVRSGQAGVPVVIAGVVAAPGAEPDEPGIRAFLRTVLPEPVLPARIVVVDAIPVSGNGKVDRGALPEPPPVRHPGHTAPVSEMERTIAALWCEVLRVDQVAVTVNFFDLGGSSLLMAVLHVGLEERLGRSVPVTLLFEHPTVRALAQHFTAGASVGTAGWRPGRNIGTLRERRLAARGTHRSR